MAKHLQCGLSKLLLCGFDVVASFLFTADCKALIASLTAVSVQYIGPFRTWFLTRKKPLSNTAKTILASYT